MVGNLTATIAVGPGYVTLWPASPGPRPRVSTINVDAALQTRANAVMTPLGSNGALSAYAEAGTHVVLDLSGAFLS